MMSDNNPRPRQFKGVMVSSTFTDMKEHRAALIKAIKGQGLTDIAMENDSAKADVDLIDSSLQMVRDSSAYIGVISRKYGQMPKCPKRNPDGLSITELEFNEAQKLGRPVLLFIMGDKHPLTEADVETNSKKRKKLKAFRERAKNMTLESQVHRVYATFESVEEFTAQCISSVAGLRRFLDEQSPPSAEQAVADTEVGPDADTIPEPPEFYAEPPYIGSHEFLGRRAELERLNDWASPADSHPIVLFEAIGGAGKSLLTWEWTTKHSLKVRNDWAGRFWYSFYEKGAIMADFCQRALSYMTGKPLEDFRKKKTVQLSEMLLRLLQERPWLMVLDGLERVLVAYHRFDAAQVLDEEAGRSDQIAHRDPCAAIRPEDDDLLRALAAAGPSKLVLTSRLVPRVLLNPASQPIPGVLRVPLPGLRPADAEALLRSCGITGDTQNIQHYLKSHCDCHPLVTGALAGLINDYLPDRGNFDAWADDPAYGGHLNLASLDLIQKRNHILSAALSALPEKSRQLLSTLALISEAVDYATLSAINPHLPPEPELVEEPKDPKDDWEWEYLDNDEQELALQNFEQDIQWRHEYEQALAARLQSPEFLAAPQELTKTVRDLERRGLLQYDPQAKRHDLHPVVRGIAAGGLRPEEKENYGQRIVDYFSRQTHDPYEQAETIEDLRDSLHVVRTLLQMERYEQAWNAYAGEMSLALGINLEAYAEQLSIMRQFYPNGWSNPPVDLTDSSMGDLANSAAASLEMLEESEEAINLYGGSLLKRSQEEFWSGVIQILRNVAISLDNLRRYAKANLCIRLSLEIATLIEDEADIFKTRVDLFLELAELGQWEETEAMWQLVNPMGRNWTRFDYIPGNLETYYGFYQLYKGTLTEQHLRQAEELARAAKNRFTIRLLHRLRAAWYMEQSEWALAADSLREAVRMAREVGQPTRLSEAMLALARFHLGELSDPYNEALQLEANYGDEQALAELWFAIGEKDRAKACVLQAYKYAWADGEPYARRYELDKARALLERLGEPIPDLPPYDPAKDEKLPWEDELQAAIEKLRADIAAKKAAQANNEGQEPIN